MLFACIPVDQPSSDLDSGEILPSMYALPGDTNDPKARIFWGSIAKAGSGPTNVYSSSP